MDKVTVLLPGGFKPPHSGHLGLANKFANNPIVDKVIVMVGPSPRDGITREQRPAIWYLLPTHPKIEVVPTSEENPMTAAFNYVFSLPKNSQQIVALGASAKSPEDAKRSKIFVGAIKRYKTKPTKDGLKAPVGVKAVEMTDDSPSTYLDRTDDKNGKGISATVLRDDLKNNDFDNFKTNYPGVKSGVVNSIFNILKKTNSSVKLKEEIKRKLKNIIINILKENDDQKNVNNATKKANDSLFLQRKEELKAAQNKLKSAQEEEEKFKEKSKTTEKKETTTTTIDKKTDTEPTETDAESEAKQEKERKEKQDSIKKDIENAKKDVQSRKSMYDAAAKQKQSSVK